MPGETKEVGVYVDSDSSFTSIKMNVITTSNSINFAGITYNEAFTKTNNGRIKRQKSRRKSYYICKF